MGKSRLAFEYAKKLQEKTNNAGFYTYSDGFNFAEWQPNIDTFIVIDYAGSNPTIVRDLLSKLTERENIFSKKVRVLLLERTLESPNNWYYDTLLNGSGNIIEDTLHSTPHAIGKLEDEALFSIAQSFCSAIEKVDFIDKLQKIDGKKRPLFAALLAESFAQHREGLDKTQLIKTFLQRTKENYWSDIEQNYFLLASILTIIEKGDVDELSNGIVNSCCPVDMNTAIFDTLLGLPEGDNWVYNGIEPDIIGELFVLELLGKHRKDRLFQSLISDETREKILSYLWEKNAWNMTIFLDRCRQDYLLHPSTLELGNKRFLSSKISKYFWSLHNVNLINAMGEHDIEKAQSLFENLEAFAKEHPDNEEIALEVAKGSVIIIAYSDDKDFALLHYDRLVQYPDLHEMTTKILDIKKW